MKNCSTPSVLLVSVALLMDRVLDVLKNTVNQHTVKVIVRSKFYYFYYNDA